VDALCVFPFIHNGIEHNACSWFNGDEHPWCSTKVDTNGIHVDGQSQYGHCGEHCPIEGNSTAAAPTNSEEPATTTGAPATPIMTTKETSAPTNTPITTVAPKITDPPTTPMATKSEVQTSTPGTVIFDVVSNISELDR